MGFSYSAHKTVVLKIFRALIERLPKPGEINDLLPMNLGKAEIVFQGLPFFSIKKKRKNSNQHSFPVFPSLFPVID